MNTRSPPNAVVLLSGGLDSATVLALAKAQGYLCYALSFDYGQRHGVELKVAERIAEQIGVKKHLIFPLSLNAIGGSALTDHTLNVPTTPQDPENAQDAIPVTYVPARNLVFLSIALAWAESLDIHTIFIGANAVDYSGYPDCRPAFIKAFKEIANIATKSGVQHNSFNIKAPLISMSKSEIIKCGTKLGLDYSLTVSCYQANAEGEACGVCDACRFRRQGFAEAGIADPTSYYQNGNNFYE